MQFLSTTIITSRHLSKFVKFFFSSKNAAFCKCIILLVVRWTALILASLTWKWNMYKYTWKLHTLKQYNFFHNFSCFKTFLNVWGIKLKISKIQSSLPCLRQSTVKKLIDNVSMPSPITKRTESQTSTPKIDKNQVKVKPSVRKRGNMIFFTNSQ